MVQGQTARGILIAFHTSSPDSLHKGLPSLAEFCDLGAVASALILEARIKRELHNPLHTCCGPYSSLVSSLNITRPDMPYPLDQGCEAHLGAKVQPLK